LFQKAKPENWGFDMIEFLENCLVKDPTKRPSALDLLAHPFVRNSPGSEIIIDRINEFISIRNKSLAMENYSSKEVFIL
jgi:serine/threonine protein kinase